MSHHTLRPATRCIHAGTYIDSRVGGVNTPIYASSSFRHPNPEGNAVCYPRYGNIPTQKAVDDKIAALENAEAGMAVSSGMAAVAVSVLAFVGKGDHAVFQSDIYGGTHHFISAELERYGVEVTMVPGVDARAVIAAIRGTTRVVYLETPTNPTLRIMDLAAVAAHCRPRGIATVVDNTFATPIFQRPLDLGCDVAAHSGTKYMSGHSDLCCGLVAASHAHMERIRERSVNLGTTLNPQDCSLLERSMKTLALRMERHAANAQAVAEFLAAHPKVAKVFYPGLPQHEGHELARKQMHGFGGMLSFELKGALADAQAAVARLGLISPAVSLGGVESLITFPALTSHVKMPAADRAAIGVTDTLLRLSVGIEDAADIIDDLRQAIEG
ncbi:MAG: PLP-dependent aspartate aminotransferase family protein [Desulfovibrionaceae bacterium]